MESRELQIPKVMLTKTMNPFEPYKDRTVNYIMHRPGMTLLDCRNEYFPAEIEPVISINGKIIAREAWHLAFPRPTDCIVMTPHIASGDTGKAILGILLFIVVAVVAFYLAPLVLPGLLGISATGSTMHLISMGIMLGGSLLISALTPKPKAKMPTLGNTGDWDRSATYGWAGAINTQQQGLVIPVVYGTHRVGGNVIAAFKENVNSKQYLNLLIALSEGPIQGISGILINSNAFSNYQGVSLESRLGEQNEEVIASFNDTKTEYPYSVKLTKAGGPFQLTTIGSNFNALEIEVAFPSGIYEMGTDGSLKKNVCGVKIQVRKEGEETWHPITVGVLESGGINIENRWTGGCWVDAWIEEEGCLDKFWIESVNGVGYPWPEQIAEGAIVNDPDTGLPMVGDWENMGFASPTKYLQWHFVPQYQPLWSPSLSDISYIGGSQTSAVIRTFFVYGLEKGSKYEIKLERVSNDQTDIKYMSDLYLIAYREIMSDDFQYPFLAKLGIRALASEQLSGSINVTSLVEGRKIAVYDGADWETKFNNNPAWVVWDLLTNTRYGGGISSTRLDLGMFYEWAQFCDEPLNDGKGGTERRAEFNGVFDAETSVWEAILDVCQVGYAILVWNGVNLTVAIDKASDPVQMFSSGNIIQDTFKEMFLPMEDRATEIEIFFADRDNDYERGTIMVLDPLAVKSNKASITLLGVTKASQAWRQANFRIKANKYLTRTVSFDADVEAIACTVGDRILVQHDIPQWGFGGRIVSATNTSVTLDQAVTLEEGKEYEILIKYDDDSTVEKAITNAAGVHTVINVATPFDVGPLAYNAFALGEVDKAAKDFRILALTKSADQRRTITAIEYRAELYQEGVPILPDVPYTDLPVALAPIPWIACSEMMVKQQDGTILTYGEITFGIPNNQFWRYAEIWVNEDNNWFYKGKSDSGYLRVGPLQDGKTYIIAACSVNEVGQRERLEVAKKVTVHIYGKTLKPADVDNFTVRQVGGNLIFEWDAVDEVDMWGYEIRKGDSWDNSILVATNITATHFATPIIGAGEDITYLIKAKDTSGNFSDNATAIVMTIDEQYGRQGLLSTEEGPWWVGTKNGTLEAENKLRLDTLLKAKDLTQPAKDYDDRPASALGGTMMTGYYYTDPIDLSDQFKVGVSVAYNVSYFDFINIAKYMVDPAYTYTSPIMDGNRAYCSIAIEYSLSDNGVDWSAWNIFREAEYTFRYIKFKIILASTHDGYSPGLENFKVMVDAPIRTMAWEDETIPIVGKSLTFTPKFYAVPALSIMIQDAQAGDFPVISNKLGTGVDLLIKNSGGSPVQRSVDVIAQGY